MTLQSLTLVNYQRHRNLVIKLDPNVTCLVGNSDSGKSSVLRALRQLCFNPRVPNRPKGVLPKGPKHARHGKKGFKLCLKVDGHKIVLKKGPVNGYWLDGKKYSAIRSDVPKEIAELLNISPISFSRQHDKPFWLHLSPMQISRELNAIIDLNIIDQTLGNASAQVRQVQSSLNETKERLRSAKEEVKKLDWVESFAKKVDQLSQLTKRIETLESRYQKGEELVSEFTEVSTRVKKLGKKSELNTQSINRLEKIANKAIEIQQRIDLAETLLTDVEYRKKEVKRSAERLTEIENELADKMKGIKECPLCLKTM